MGNSGILGDTLGKVGDLGKQTGKDVSDEAEKAVTTARQQVVGLENQENIDVKNANSNQRQAQNLASNSDTRELIKALYAKSGAKADSISSQIAQEIAEKHRDKTPEEIKKMTDFRMQLHKDTYFDPTFNPHLHKQAPRPAEKVEKEEKEKKQMEALEFQKEEKTKEDLLAVAAKQGTHEKIPGVSG